MHRRALLSLTLIAALSLRAEEGMWTFDNPPLAAMQKAYGFAPDQAWLDHVRLSVLEFGGGTGSFVSRDGLVITNHHVAQRALEKVSSQGDKDYRNLGFVAKTRAEELKIPDLKLYTIMQMVDVTEKANAAVKPGMDEKQAMAARLDKLEKLRKDLDQRNGLIADTVTLYRGGQYWLYTYKVHRDVRLVAAPEAKIAFFGGDPDNFTYPRHDLDFAILRVYEGGEPYHPAHYLKWAGKGLVDGDFTLVAGLPGRTRRQETLAQMAFQRDVVLPDALGRDQAERAALNEYGSRSPEHARRVEVRLFSIENEIKRGRGELDGLKDPQAWAALEAKEQELRAAVAADEALKAETGGSWGRIEGAVADQKPLHVLRELTNSRNSKLLATALDVVRCARELDLPRKDRLDGFRTADDEDYRKWKLQNQIPFDDPDLETFLIAKGLEDLQAQLPADHPLRKALDRSPAEIAKQAVEGTKLQAIYVRRDVIVRGAKGVASSGDPMVRLAALLEDIRRPADKRYEELQDVVEDQSGRLARVRFQVGGRGLYPDGTSTLRFSYGRVEGYPDQGATVQPFTTFAGLYRLADTKGPTSGGRAWVLPSRWQERRSQVDLTVPLNFCHSVDIVGGNSGSPVVNAQGEFAGLIFDGNLQSLPGYFYYDGRVNRAVSVDARAVLEALRKVYDAPQVADELMAR